MRKRKCSVLILFWTSETHQKLKRHLKTGAVELFNSQILCARTQDRHTTYEHRLDQKHQNTRIKRVYTDTRKVSKVPSVNRLSEMQYKHLATHADNGHIHTGSTQENGGKEAQGDSQMRAHNVTPTFRQLRYSLIILCKWK